MFKLQKSILDISYNYYKYLINLENVHGVGLGHKHINNVNTLEPCIHVLVNNKIDLKYISNNNIIPKYYMGIKTDVIKTGKMTPCGGTGVKGKFRPLVGGCMITPLIEDDDDDIVIIPEGTLGCIVTKVIGNKKKYYILSNNHVMALYNQNPIGTPILQTYDSDNLNIKDIVGYLTDFIPVKFIEGNKKPINYVDAAIAMINSKTSISSKIYDVGKIKGIADAILEEDIKKVGKTSGLTFGQVKTIGVTDEVEVSDEELILYKDQIIANIEVKAGDSGSVVLNKDNKIIGLLMGGGEGWATINNINRVLKELNVDVYTEE